MRSLTCLSSINAVLPPVSGGSGSPGSSASAAADRAASALAFNPESGVVYVATERGSTIDIFEVAGINTNQMQLIASLTASAEPSFLPRYSTARQHVLSLRFLSESQSLCVILAGGDITTIALSPESATEANVEVVGMVDAGIKAAEWSPDEELLILITGDDMLLEMTKDFEVLKDSRLRSDDFGEGTYRHNYINVGWGSKQTQFHGSAGKTAAQTPMTQAIPADRTSSTPDDDHAPRISWRGDGAHFAISSLDLSAKGTSSASSNATRRVVRTYSRQAELQSTSEPVVGLEHVLAWRPSGELIASTQRFGTFDGAGEGREGRHDVVFFERNGLRHGEFELREGAGKIRADAGAEDEGGRLSWGWEYRVQELCWNADSTLLAVWLRRDESAGDVVQVWMRNNYHWYLKQEITPLSDARSPFLAVSWHPEKAMELAVLTAGALEMRSFSWDTFGPSLGAPRDAGVVAVTDGASLLVTPFRTQNVPPPMSSTKLVTSHSSRPVQPPIHVAFAPSLLAPSSPSAAFADEAFALLFATEVHVRHVVSKLDRSQPGRIQTYSDPVVLPLPPNVRARQISLRLAEDGKGSVVVLGWDADALCDALWFSKLDNEKAAWESIALPSIGRANITAALNGYVFQSKAGDLLFFAGPEDDLEPLPTALSTFCPCVKATDVGDFPILVALSPLGKLFVLSAASDEAYQVAADCTSFTLSTDFLIYTTTTHESKYAPLTVLGRILDGGYLVSEHEKTWESRRVERGSVIVTVISTTMALILQMPRGNLETIYPRPLVLAGVRRDLNAGRYRDAFVTCRKHRIDMNILHDYDPAAFFRDLAVIVEQIDNVDHINLILGGLKNEDVSKSMYPAPGLPAASTSSFEVPGKVNRICDAMMRELDRDMLKYVDSILTAHVVKTPPDHEEALRMLHRLKGQHPKVVEDAIKYVIFLTDVNRLFDVALGMYDFGLVLMIAQFSQKDPREYLPFLKELKALNNFYQRFRIDDHLERWAKALANLQLAGPAHFEEATDYIEKHDLYREALAIWSDDEEPLKAIYEIYGDHLYYRRNFHDAALAFTMAGNRARALKSYDKAHAWKELFTLAKLEKLPEEEMQDLVQRIANDLSSRARYGEAGRVLLDYGTDLAEEAVSNFCQGRDYAEAYRISSLRDKPELIESVIHPSLLATQAFILEDVAEIEEQMEKQLSRLAELAILKAEQPDTFFMQDDPALENIDVMTDATGATEFTRYTNNASTVLTRFTGLTKTTNQSSKMKRKNARKAASGRKGTVDEELYLLGSFARLVDKFKTLIADAAPVLDYLLIATLEHRRAGIELQQELIKTESALLKAVDSLWPVEPNASPVEPPKELVRPTRPIGLGDWKGGNGFLGL